MIDLFGMGKSAPAAETPEHGPEEPRKPQGSHGLWLFLLVLDSVFVAVFGGAVALKVYQYWKAPISAVAPVARRHPAPKAPETPKPAEQAAAPKPPAPPPAPATAAPKPVATPEPRIARAPSGPRPPKPSLINEAPKPRSTPGLASGAAAPAPAPAAAASPAKALPVVFKLRAARAGSVQLVGAFIVHGGRKEMTKASDGTWSLKLYLNPGQYRYFFSVDKKKTLDPENPNSDRGASLLTVP